MAACRPDDVPMHSGNVLIVDDDQNLTFVLRAHLAHAGFQVDVCHDGQEGFERARRNLPDVIVLDIQMPSMDGLEVTRKLRLDPRTRNIPVILMTGRTGSNDIVLGLEAGAISRGLSAVKKVPGRFEKVDRGQPFSAVVDYAHTPDALENVLENARAITEGRIITVFGCGGDRDRGKRPKMGRVVEENADIAIVTSDNPRSEEPGAIIDDILQGLHKHDHIVIPDRRDAIYRTVELARERDIVLIAGKGHEDYQILGDSTIHFDDCEVARDAIRDLK